MTQKYDPVLVEAVKTATEAGKTPVDILQDPDINVPQDALMAIIRDAGEHGWDSVKAEVDANWLDDDEAELSSATDPDEPTETTLAADPDEQSPSETDPDDSDVSAIQAEQARAIRDVVDHANHERRKKKKKKKNKRGHKQANVKRNFVMNRERRKRKGGNPQDNRRRLLMDMQKKHPEFEYRWVLDRPGRIRAMQADDWDIVNDAHIDPDGQGGNVSAVAGTNHYEADNMILMRKYKPWYADDQVEKLAGADEIERQINGQKTGGSSLVDNVGPQELIERLKNSGVDSTNTYVPVGEKNRVGRVSESLT